MRLAKRKSVIIDAPIFSAGGRVAERVCALAGPHDSMILPGMIIKVENNEARAYDEVGLIRPGLVALPNSTRRKDRSSPSMETPYVYRDEQPHIPNVYYARITSEMTCNLLLKAGVGVNQGDLLESAGDGTLQIGTDRMKAFAVATEQMSAAGKIQPVVVEVI